MGAALAGVLTTVGLATLSRRNLLPCQRKRGRHAPTGAVTVPLATSSVMMLSLMTVASAHASTLYPTFMLTDAANATFNFDFSAVCPAGGFTIPDPHPGFTYSYYFDLCGGTVKEI